MLLSKPILIAVVAMVWTSGCASFPGLEAGPAVATSQAPVALLPMEDILAQLGGDVANDATAADLAARAARLRARAAASR